MNMKKTIAAIAAGAVAVSAMATTVSATLESTTLNYNLVNTVKTTEMGKSVVSYQIQDIPTDANIVIDLSNDADNNYGTWNCQELVIDGKKVPCKAFRKESDDAVVKGTAKAYPKYVTVYVDYSNGTGITTVDRSVFKFANYNETGYDWFDSSDSNDTVVTIPAASLSATGSQAQITVEVTYEHDSDADDNILKGYKPAIEVNTKTPTYSYVKDYSKKGDKVDAKYPFHTGLTDNVNIIKYLENNNVNGEDKSYKNVGAVLNDAIQNYDSVTFTFNTATEKVKDGKYDADGDDKYLSFAQHLYDGYYAPESTGFVGYDWEGYNLFQGALVVNESYTMSLYETDYFDWTATTLSFDWDAIMDGAATSNGYATYIHSLKLATSSDWYWDSMSVVLTAGAADDVENEAGTEADDETLDEEIDDEEVVEDEADEEEVVADEEEEEVEVEVEVSNPSTGNASVALAVIPVALAAAAVVAKKRN